MLPSGKWIDGIDPDGSVEDAARRSLKARLTAVAQALPLAAHLADHDVEHVHRLRVATRRAIAALKLYRDWLPDKPARWLKKRLKKIRRAAGEELKAQTREYFGYYDDLPPAERKHAQGKYREWWESRGKGRFRIQRH